MEVHFTPEQQARLTQIAARQGSELEELIKHAALSLVAEEDRFKAFVREGIVQADRGELVDDEAVRLWLESRERL